MLELKTGCLSALYLLCLDSLRNLDVLEYFVKFSVVLLFCVPSENLASCQNTAPVDLELLEQQLSLTSLVVSEPLVL